MLDTFVLKNLDMMNLHEFTTSLIYYFNPSHHDVCSPQLRRALLHKMNASVSELNEYQLHIFKKLALGTKYTQDAQNDQPLVDMIEEVVMKIDHEISEV